MQQIQFIDLKTQQQVIKNQVNEAISRVLEHGQYILGPEVSELESKLCDYTGAKYTVTCANGTDALKLLLMANNVRVNDAVFVPSFTFAATAEVVSHLKATPIFIDICEDTFNMCPKSLESGILHAKQIGLNPKGIIPVDLFGLPADYPTIQEIANMHNLWILADSAQSFGGAINNHKVGSLAPMSATSFFPAKPLGCYGDGGAIFVNSEELDSKLRSLRMHGASPTDRYDHIHIGINSRLDSMQAAVLLEKLKIFDIELEKRKKIAKFYLDNLDQTKFKLPFEPKGFKSGWGLFTIICQDQIDREKLLNYLKEQQIPATVYYRKPMHKQPIYQNCPSATNNLPISEKLANKVVSIPMHPYLTDEQIEYIVTKLNKF